MKFRAALIALLLSCNATAETALIAVASNFSSCFQVFIRGFEESTSHAVRAAYGSTGTLYAQITQGAPFDAFLSADQRAAERLVTSGLALSNSNFSYAIGRLQLWSNSYSLKGLSLGQALRDPRLTKLALAKPLIAPYGRAAVQVLSKLDLQHAVDSKLVYGENVSQSFQFVSSKNAQLGFAAAAQLANTPSTHKIPVPSELHAPITQNAVLLKRASKNSSARQLLAFIASEQGRNIIRNCGYEAP